MTLNELESDLYRRLGFQASPDPVVTTRLRAYLNQTQREILSQKGLHKLRHATLQTTSIANDPYIAFRSPCVRVIRLVDTAHQRVLRPLPIEDLRLADPGLTATGVPDGFSVISLATASARNMADSSGFALVSTSPLDGATKTAHVELYAPESGAELFQFAVTLNGTTIVPVPFSPQYAGGHPFVNRLYLGLTAGGGATAAAGTIVLSEGLTGTGRAVSVMYPGRHSVRYTRLQLFPIPTTAITYTADVDLTVEDMDIGGDEPALPEDFHWVLTSGALLKEWQRMEKTSQYDREKATYREGIGDLKMFVSRAGLGDGKNGNGNGLHDSSFGPWYPIGGVSTAAPHAPTHEPGGNDPMTVDALPAIGSLRTLGSGPHQAAPGDDPRFTSGGGGPHHLTHESGGTDALSVLLLAGYPGGTTGFLRADATFATPATGGGAHHATHEPGGTDAMAVDAAAATGSLRTLGTGANQAAPGNDTRFTAAPQLHATTHQPGGTDAMAVDAIAATGSLRTLGTGSQQAAAGDDSRLTNARTPLAHETTHRAGGSDQLQVTLLAGYPANPGLFLNGTGNFTIPGGTVPGSHHVTHEPGGTDPIANAAWTNQSNTFAEVNTFAKQVVIDSANPALFLYEADQPANAKRWQVVPDTQWLRFRALDDTGTAVAAPLSMDRSGNATVGNNLTVPGSGGNVACKDQANTFTQAQVVSMSGPTLVFINSADPADARRYRQVASGQQLLFYSQNDAGSDQSFLFGMNRSGDAFVQRDVYEKARVTPMGHWTDVPYSAGNFTCAAGTWTVAAGNVTYYKYALVGKTIHVLIYLQGTTLSTASGTVTVALPAGISGSQQSGIVAYKNPGAGYAVLYPSGTGMLFYKDLAGTGWASGTLELMGSFTFSIT